MIRGAWGCCAKPVQSKDWKDIPENVCSQLGSETLWALVSLALFLYHKTPCTLSPGLCQPSLEPHKTGTHHL